MDHKYMQDESHIGLSAEWLFHFHDIDTEAKWTVGPCKNLIVQSGLESLAAIFIDELPQNNAMFLALGTGTTPATSIDKKLEVEEYRKIVTSKTRNLNEVRLRFFLNTNEGIGDWSELGVMLFGTEIPDSGTMLNRILPPGGISKASNQTLTVEVRIKFEVVS